MEWFIIYLLVHVSNIGAAIGSIATPMMVVSVLTYLLTAFICLMATWDDFGYGKTFSEYMDDCKKWRNLLHWTFGIGFSFMMVSTLIPSHRDMAIIAAGGATYNIITSEPAQRIGGKAIDLLEKRIDEALQEKDNVDDDSVKSDKHSQQESKQI